MSTRTLFLTRWVGLFLALGVALGAQAEPPVKLPGRKADSREPWALFLGRTAHIAISKQYAIQHPRLTVFLDPTTLRDILIDGHLGDPSRLPDFVRQLRPDITDTSTRVLFEIKPDNEDGRAQAREQAGRYLAALNPAVTSGKKLTGGTGFTDSLLIEFEKGGALWQLSWHTPEPGVTLYRWSYRRKKPQASWKERMAQPEEELPDKEAEQSGALAEQAIRAAYEGGELPSAFQGTVYLPVDCRRLGLFAPPGD